MLYVPHVWFFSGASSWLIRFGAASGRGKVSVRPDFGLLDKVFLLGDEVFNSVAESARMPSRNRALRSIFKHALCHIVQPPIVKLLHCREVLSACANWLRLGREFELQRGRSSGHPERDWILFLLVDNNKIDAWLELFTADSVFETHIPGEPPEVLSFH
jgi:hypothetical protein